MSERLTITAKSGGTFQAYVARPATQPAPAIVVLHEVFGVNRDIRLTCNELAEQGFVAVAPDLFWRQEPGVDLRVDTESDWQHGLRLYLAYDRDAGVGDIADTVRAVSQLSGTTGRTGVMGYCLGGLMTYLTAVRSGIDAGVAYHGGDTDAYLGEADRLHAPLLMHLAEEDEFISRDAQSRIRVALGNKPDVTIHSYPGQRHAFSRHDGAHYNAAAAALARSRTVQFFKRALG